MLGRLFNPMAPGDPRGGTSSRELTGAEGQEGVAVGRQRDKNQRDKNQRYKKLICPNRLRTFRFRMGS
jgi:hypothetical protein